MTKLVLTRGLPASGKSTYARNLIAEDPTFVRLNRDDFRQMLFGKAVLDSVGEVAVTIAQHGAMEKVLKSGMNVIVDDTNFFARGVRDLIKIAYKHDAEVEFVDFTDVSLEECINRDIVRRQQGNSNLSDAVGEKVIRGMYDRYLKGRKLPLPIPAVPNLEIEPYVADTTKLSAILVDIDGTLAKMADRSPYDWHRVGEDEPVLAVIEAVKAAMSNGDEVIVMSGRDGSCREITEKWLTRYLDVSWSALFMRAPGDQRRDDIVKYGLFNEHIRNNYNVKYVLDDRPQVCRMWRKLGLFVFQVGDPYIEF
jgi:predicted kinase